jgi:uncharacterized damage-inducible protein DinB
MKISDAFVAELDHESKATRRVLERVPLEKFEWRPHPKSTSLGALASHLATLPRMVLNVIEKDELEINPAAMKPWRASSTAELLSEFDRNIRDAHERLASASNEHLMSPWTFKIAGKTVFTLPRAAVLRNAFFNHTVHHRGQMTVYLRLNDVSVPGLYGPSADEPVQPF